MAGSLAAAEAAYHDYLRHEPSDGETLHRLAVLMGQTDRPAVVVALETAALGAGYCTSSLFANMALAHHALGDPFAAGEAAAKALDLAPADQALLDDLAPLLRASGREPRLLSACMARTASRERGLDELLEFGSLAAELGRLDLAAPAFLNATECFPDTPEAWRNLATLQMMAGRTSEAEAAGWEAVSRNPLPFEDLFLLAQLGLDLQARNELHARVDFHLDTEAGRTSAHLQFAAARLLEDEAAIPSALHHYAIGNGLVRARMPHDRKRSGLQFDRLASLCSSAPVRMKLGRSASGRGGPVPIFIVGAPRTGSTLVEHMLCRKGDAFPAGELVWFQRIVRHVLERERLSFPDGLGQISDEGRDLIRSRYLEILRERADGALHVIDKLPSNILYAPLALTLFPEARIIMTDRSSADACLSIYRHLFSSMQSFAYDIFDIAHHLAGIRRIAGAIYELAPDRAIILPLEDLVGDPEAKIAALMAFCGISPRTDAAERPRLVQTASALQVRKPVNRAEMHLSELFRPHFPDLQEALVDAGICEA